MASKTFFDTNVLVTGVVHRDVKPDNIMLSKSGAVKVLDFGIARVLDSSLTKTGSVMGTPAYMSPEQVNGVKVDGRSDIFSLGVILYELLTGKKPFKGDTMPSLMFAIIKEEPPSPSTVDASIAPVWGEILKKALAKNRDERYATVKEFATAVRGTLRSADHQGTLPVRAALHPHGEAPDSGHRACSHQEPGADRLAACSTEKSHQQTLYTFPLGS